MYRFQHGEQSGTCDYVLLLLLTLRTLLNAIVRVFEFMARNLILRGACWIAHSAVDD